MISVILMLFTAKAKTNGPAFLVGWVIGLSAVALVVYSLTDSIDIATDDDAASSRVFVLLGSLSIAVPVVYALFGGESARHTLDGWKAWLGQTNATVMAVLLLVIGAKIIGDGLGWI